ncbi:MAG: hypothetical protein HZY76_09830 [Anaerolineae bacterium]|nr:MAG: hypothetical protein HZY76_09830 [Anaerolineae bacterium]
MADLTARQTHRAAAIALSRSLLGLDPRQVAETIERDGLEAEKQGIVRFLRDA